MITCRELAELLIDFVSDDLPQSHRDRIEQHLRSCPPCVAYVESYKVTIRLTKKLPTVPLPVGFVQRLLAAAEKMQKEGPGTTGGPE